MKAKQKGISLAALLRNVPWHFLFAVVNMLYMHQFFAWQGLMEEKLYAYSPLMNVCVTVFDVSVVYLLFLLLTWGRQRLSLSLTFWLTLVWAFVNVFYGRFFSQYLPLSAVAQAGSLGDGLVVDSMLAGFLWSDLFFVAMPVAFIFFCRKRPAPKRLTRRALVGWVLTPLLSLVGVGGVYTLYHFANPKTRGNTELFVNRINSFIVWPSSAKNSFPNEVRYHNGIVRILWSELSDLVSRQELSDAQRQEIARAYGDHSLRSTGHELSPEVRNCVFIILESFLAVSSDMVVDGQPITPFLDSLRHAPGVYYNGHVQPNITIGESGDGQFIYMTGLLPLRSKLTVGEAKTNTLPGLPSVMRQRLGLAHTEIVIPSKLGMWQQERMNEVYGIECCYKEDDAPGYDGNVINDEQLFAMAMQTDKTAHQPFASFVLSVSTHQPYTKAVDPTFALHDDRLPVTMLNYLNACHYTDRQIRRYFDHLKQEGLLEKTLVVIAADHHPHLSALGTDDVSTDLPLYIVNGNIDTEQAWQGKCQQLDVYTTLLDVMGVDAPWLGLGHTLLSADYQDSVDERAWQLSEWIIEGNYFSSSHQN